MKFAILGPPGSGKGTYSSRLESRLDIEHISVGDLCREAIERGGKLGKKIKEYYDRGNLVPSELINEMLEKKLDEIGRDDFVLDGYPRNAEQAKFLNETIGIDGIILLDVPESVLVKRLSSRRICEDCGEVYNKIFLKPEEGGVCDECGGDLYQREDDKPEGIKARIERYEEKKEPVIDYFKGKVPFVKIRCEEAGAPIKKMIDKIVRKLDKKDLVS